MDDILYKIKKAYMNLVNELIKRLIIHYYKLDKTLLSFSFGLDPETEFYVQVAHYYSTYYTIGTKVITLEELTPDEKSRKIQPYILHFGKNTDRIANKLDISEETKTEEKKMKDAKEMFADLGYIVKEDDEYQIRFYNEEKDIQISFWYEDLKVEIVPFKPIETSAKIDMPLLHAINQECKELEWI